MFQKGQSGNPEGRPKDSISLTSMIKRKLKEMSPDGKREAIEVLAENIIQQALDGHPVFGKLVWNYLDGLPQEKIDLTSMGDRIIPIYAGKSVPRYISNEEDIQLEEKSESGSRRDISV